MVNSLMFGTKIGKLLKNSGKKRKNTNSGLLQWMTVTATFIDIPVCFWAE